MMELTPFDFGAIAMLESLTEREVVATKRDDNFTIQAFYNKHNNPDYISAIIDAVIGRFKERFIEVKDDPDRSTLEFSIAYDKIDLQIVGEVTGYKKPHLCFGSTYCHKLEEIRAVQVTIDNAKRLKMFVGGGLLAVEKAPGNRVSFSFLNNGTFVDVPEYYYIVKRENATHFEIMSKEKFEEEWEPKK